MSDGGPTYRDEMRQLIAGRFEAVWRAAPRAIDGTDPEGVHDVRVASRRLRAAMDVADGCFPERWYRPLHRVAKAITSSLGEVRDREVLLEFLTAERAAAPASDGPGIERLIERVEREHSAARRSMRAFLEGLEQQGVRAESERRFGSPTSSTQGRS